ncbi:unnamed protein product [Durusdinium trenchii]|uniref:Sulfite oxidase n=1 Tax=Durusdinium trenchii TaxID=1381693 RepID=A0ABP0JKL5_9DINO
MASFYLAASAAFIYFAIDLTLWVLQMVVAYNRASMITTVIEILDDNAPLLLSRCPSWTIPMVNELRDTSWVGYCTLGIYSAGAALITLAGFSYQLSICAPGGCPNTPTFVVHILAVFSLFLSGSALIFTNIGFALEWQNDGNPFYGGTEPRSFDGYYESSCFGYGGCSGSYVNVEADKDTWCPTGMSPLADSAITLQTCSGVAFAITWPILLVGLPVSCCCVKDMTLRYLAVTPALLVSILGLVIGGIQFPMLLPYIFAHALWQYVRLLVNRIAGIDQAKVDKDFKEQRNSDDVVPGVIGAPSGDGDIGVVDDHEETLATSSNRGYTNLLEPENWRHTDSREDITSAELQLAKRCHGAHIETLSQDITEAASHYLLIHYDVPYFDVDSFRLSVTGLVEKELSVSLSEIKGRPASTQAVLMACAGTGRMSTKHRFWTHVPWGVDSFGCAKWTGCSLAELLREAGLKDGAKQVIFTGADKGVEAGKVQYYQRSLSVEDALRGHVMLVYEMNGEPLKPAHGFPLRLIVPGWYGMASVKWLTKIEVVEGPWWGHQMEAYSFRRAANDPERVPLTQLPVRALMAPPGVPDFFSRTRVVEPGTQRITGKVWAGAVDIERVEVSCDHGKTWAQATLEEKNGVFGWANWYYDWQTPGEGNFVLMCRGFDKKGRSQDPTSDEAFNWTGMGDTQPQMVYVRVDSKIQDVGNQINLIPETRAAKKSLNVATTDGKPLATGACDALYRQPGSQ